MSTKLFHCTIQGCDYTAKRRDGLKSHINTHTRAVIFTCQWPGCDRTFANSSSRSRHFGIHSTGKNHLCDWEGCGFRSAYKKGIQKHATRHEGARPHICATTKTCSQLCFATLEELERHRKGAHPQEDGDVDIDADEQDFPTPSQPVAPTSKSGESSRTTRVSTSRKSTTMASSSTTVETERAKVSSTTSSASKKTGTPSKPRRQQCSQLHCTYTTRKPARLAKHSTRHTAVLPFLCLEKKCLAAFATAKAEQEHGYSVHKRPAEPKTVSKKRKRKHKDNDEDKEIIDLTQSNEVDNLEITPVTPAPKRRKVEGPMTPPATQIPRTRKGKEREVVLTSKEKGKGKERAVSPSVSVSSFHPEESSAIMAPRFYMRTASAGTNATASSSKLPIWKAGPYELLKQRELFAATGKKRKLTSRAEEEPAPVLDIIELDDDTDGLAQDYPIKPSRKKAHTQTKQKTDALPNVEEDVPTRATPSRKHAAPTGSRVAPADVGQSSSSSAQGKKRESGVSAKKHREAKRDSAPEPMGSDENTEEPVQDDVKPKRMRVYASQSRKIRDADAELIKKEEDIRTNVASSGANASSSTNAVASSSHATPNVSTSVKRKRRESNVVGTAKRAVREHIDLDEDASDFVQDTKPKVKKVSIAQSRTKIEADAQILDIDEDTETQVVEEEVGNSESEDEADGEMFTKDEVQARINDSLRPLIERVGALKNLVREAVEARR